MRKSVRIKAIGLAVSMICVVALAVAASGVTGAYFSDTKTGTVNGTLGSIKVGTSGGTGVDGLAFVWDNMLPGELYSTTANYVNTGRNAQDVWLVFPNKTALSALNSLGTYGAARVTSTDGAWFYSNNLNDHPVDQGDVCKMLPAKIKLASGVAPGASGSMTFTFQYASKFSTQVPGMFNQFPVLKPGAAAGAGWPNDGNAAGFDQNYVNPADGGGAGLPFQIVATQPGIEPGAAGTSAGF